MNLTATQKTIAIALGAYVVGMSTTIAGKALYSNVKIGTDRKTFIISSSVAMLTTFALLKFAK